MRAILVLIALVTSSFVTTSALADSLAGEISISLTILPVCKVIVTDSEPAVNCGDNGKTLQPKIHKKEMPGEGGMSVDSTLVTLEW